jgi:hypothetical protein
MRPHLAQRLHGGYFPQPTPGLVGIDGIQPL